MFITHTFLQHQQAIIVWLFLERPPCVRDYCNTPRHPEWCMCLVFESTEWHAQGTILLLTAKTGRKWNAFPAGVRCLPVLLPPWQDWMRGLFC